MDEEEQGEERNREEENQGVRGEEEDHGERSCFYSLSFLADRLGQTDDIILCNGGIFKHVLMPVYSNRENIMLQYANSQYDCARTYTHARI